MNTLKRYLNYIGLVVTLLGGGLMYSFAVKGVAGWAGVVLAVLGLAMLAAYFVMHRAELRERNSRMNMVFASNFTLILVLVVGIVAAVNILGTKFSLRKDLTEAQSFSLSPQSISVVKNLKTELQIKAFFSDGNPRLPLLRNLVEIYRHYSDKVSLQVIDPYKDPTAVKGYDVTSDGTAVVISGKRNVPVIDPSEENLTNAIVKVTREKEKVVYFTQGHGEPDPDKTEELGYSAVRTGLENLSYKAQKLLLFQTGRVPDDAAVVVVAGAEKPFMEGELAALDEYVSKRNGRLFLMLEPQTGAEFQPLLRKAGVQLDDGFVVETDLSSQVQSGSALAPVIGNYTEHVITRNFNYATFFPNVRSLSRVNPPPAGATVDMLAQTSPNSWGDLNLAETRAAGGKLAYDPGEKRGPLDIAAAVEIMAGDPQKKTRLVVVGDAHFAMNRYYNAAANNNFFNNCVSWLADEGDLIAISPRMTATRTIHLSESSSRLMFFYMLIILPLVVFLVGIGVWLYRRKQ